MTTTSQARVPWASELEAVLNALIASHEQMLVAVAHHREAIAQADPAALGRSMQEQKALLQRIAEAESARQALVRRIVESDRDLRAADRAGLPPPKIAQLAESLRGAAKERLLELGGRLRQLVERVQTEQGRVRLAAETLAQHMQGLARQVSRALSPAGTYGPRNAPSNTHALTLDLRT